MRLLIADDEQELVRAIAAILRFYNYTVDTVYNGIDALQKLQQYSYDGAILDIMMPGFSGLEVLQQMRQQNILIPVLLLTAKTETADKIIGLDQGADDYLGKPFAMGELVARVKAMTRRKNEYVPTILQVENLALNRETYALSVQKAAVQLSHLEFQLMEFLMLNPNRLVSADQMQERLGSYQEVEKKDHVVDLLRLYLSYLVKKIKMLQADIQLVLNGDDSCMLVTSHG